MTHSNPIICLDIDGVLNNWTDGGDCVVTPDGVPLKAFTPGPDIRPRIDAPCAEALEHILEVAPNADIILSSSWRKVLDVGVAQEWLRKNGVPSARIVARTCRSALGECGTDHSRGGHIIATMTRFQRKYGARPWCAIDDDPSIILPAIPAVHTDPVSGLTMTDARRAIGLLTEAPMADLRESVLAVLADGPKSRRQLGDALRCRWANADLDVALRRLVQEKKAHEVWIDSVLRFAIGEQDVDPEESGIADLDDASGGDSGP